MSECIKIRTQNLWTYCVCIFLLLNSCKHNEITEAPETVEEAEALLKSQEKQRIKEAKKAQKEAYKRFWKMQTKEVRKSVKRNYKNQKKKYRAKKMGY